MALSNSSIANAAPLSFVARQKTWCVLFAVASLVSLLPVVLHAHNGTQAPLAVGELHDRSFAECDVCDPNAAAFDSWENIVGKPTSTHFHEAPLRPFDWVRHFGYRHSSTDGRHVDRGIPLEGTSWQNRPYHVDWFLGPLLGDELIRNRVSQDNELLGGVRIGRDTDYYWGIEARLAWSDPNLQYARGTTTAGNASIFMSDVGLLYYPWGDSKIRPYGRLGVGLARYDFVDHLGVNHNTTLATLPVGYGVKIYHWPRMAWRLEALDNISFGSDGLSAQHNVSLTAGMELRFGARPRSYWPWRSSRSIW